MRYIPALDGLRAVAVVLVVAHHCLVPWFLGGYVGVDVFFVLSGYLITSILIRDQGPAGNLRLGNFYARRLLRLYPALVLFLVTYLVIAPKIWPDTPHIRDALFAGLYVSDYTYAFTKTPKYLGHTWSLSVEEQFYLTWPLCLAWAVQRYQLEAIRKGLMLAVVIAIVWRTHNAVVMTSSAYFRFDTRLPGLLAGCWLAIYLKTEAGAVRPLLEKHLAWIGLVGVIAVATIPNHRNTSSMLMLSIPVAEACTMAMLYGARALPLSHRALVRVGKLSYGIYLWHYPMALLLRNNLPWQLTTPIVFILSAGAAWISYSTVEASARRIKERRYKARLPR